MERRTVREHAVHGAQSLPRFCLVQTRMSKHILVLPPLQLPQGTGILQGEHSHSGAPQALHGAAACKALSHIRKIGHTGTLDPMATGVLPVCLGSATKLCDMLADRDKEYVAELLLGVETDTQDVTGQVLARCPVEVQESQVRSAAASFVGEYRPTSPCGRSCAGRISPAFSPPHHGR